MRRHRDHTLLADMLEYSRRALIAIDGKSREDLDSDFVLAAALERMIEVVGEAANKISDETKRAHGALPWREIVGMRNRLVHGYSSIDHDIVWTVVVDDLPQIIAVLEDLVQAGDGH